VACPALRNTKFGGGKSEGGAGIHFPHPPFLSAPPERSVLVSAALRAAVSQNSAQKSSCFVQ